jgi:hypothetical protein
MRGPNFILVIQFKLQVKLIKLINELSEISPLGFECQFTTHVTNVVRIIDILLWHDKNIINTILLKKHFTENKTQHLQLITT